MVNRIKIYFHKRLIKLLKAHFVSYEYFNGHHLMKLLSDKNIEIEKNVHIENTAIIRTKGKNDLIKIKKGTVIHHGVCIMSYGGKISIGEECDINPYTIIYGHGNTLIGDRVLIAGHCMIIPNNHIIKDKSIPISMQGNISKGIIISDDVWIGHGSSILDGVKIGKGAVIGAGSVVTKDVDDYSIVFGNPSRFYKNR